MMQLSYQQISETLKITWALLQRSALIVRRHSITLIIDTLISTAVYWPVLCVFLPLMGMPAHLAPVLYIGSMAHALFFRSVGIGYTTIADLYSHRFIDYLTTLPTSRFIAHAHAIFEPLLTVLLVVVPALFIGLMLIPMAPILTITKVIKVCCITIVAVCQITPFVAALAFHYPREWIFRNIWARRLSPLFLLAPAFFPWYRAYQFSPRLSLMLLLNPFTYLCEGLRAALLDTGTSIPLSICMIMLTAFSVGSWWFLSYSITKRLDLV